MIENLVSIKTKFVFVFSCIRTRNNSVFGHFSRSDSKNFSRLALALDVKGQPYS